jgi:predicted nucleotidyltransferase
VTASDLNQNYSHAHRPSGCDALPVTTSTTPDLTRYDDWLVWLRKHAEADPDLLAVWVCGSAVTGGYDEWSDLDVELLCTPGAHEATYQRLLARVLEDFDVDHVWEAPLEWWTDGRQCFVNHQARPGLLAEPTRLVDLHIASCSDAHRHVDVRRHGTPMVLHDPDGLVVLRHDDEAAMTAAMEQALDQVRQRRGTAEWLVNRALARGHLAEAVSLYVRFGLDPLVRVLRAEHCPWRHDFGLRYLDTDLPADVAARVVALVPGAPGGDLRAQSAACFAWLDDLLAGRD